MTLGPPLLDDTRLEQMASGQELTLRAELFDGSPYFNPRREW
jgi:hypothetical protein